MQGKLDLELFCGISTALLLSMGLNMRSDTVASVKVPALRSLYFVDAIHGWITGRSGIFWTVDGGKSWKKQATTSSRLRRADPVAWDLGYLAWADRTRAIVLDEEGATFLNASTGERRLIVLPGLVNSRIDALNFTDEQHGWAISFGTIYRTGNAGKSWQELEKSLFVAAHSLFLRSAHEIWIGGENTVYHSRDSGRHWASCELPTDSKAGIQVECIRFFGPRNGWACGFGPEAFVTEDGGDSWSRRTLPGSRFPVSRGVSFIDKTEGWIVGSRDSDGNKREGLVLYTSDGGLYWQSQKYDSKEGLIDVQALPNGKAWMIGEDGTAFSTNDHGRNWILRTLGNNP